MNSKKSYSRSIILAAAIILAACSSSNRYKVAKDFFLKENYVAAIQQYDNFLSRTSNGALATRAEQERSEAYYQLGNKAFGADNYLLASRLYYLANSEKADRQLDDCYYKLAAKAYSENRIEETLDYYGKIILYIEDSDLIPEVLYNRIRIFSDLGQKENAFQDYELLWAGYPESEYVTLIENTILPIFQAKFTQAKFLKNKGDLDNTLIALFNIYEYPTTIREDVAYEIGDVYFLMALREIDRGEIRQADLYFDSSLEYDPSRKQDVMNQKITVCDNILAEGRDHQKNMDISDAITTYRQCFIMIPEYDRALAAIKEAEDLEEKYEEAMTLAEEAAVYVSEKKFQSALNLYRRSYELFPVKSNQNKIKEMQNLIRAEREPKDFATAIVRNYKNGLIVGKVNQIEMDMISKYGSDMVSTSGWKALYSTGEYKYEVRYDIMTPKENFYFIWLVNLRNQEISPLNKLTESIIL